MLFAIHTKQIIKAMTEEAKERKLDLQFLADREMDLKAYGAYLHCMLEHDQPREIKTEEMKKALMHYQDIEKIVTCLKEKYKWNLH